MQGHSVWVLLDPSLEEVVDPIRWFPEVMELLKEKVKVKSRGWTVLAVVTRSLG